VAPNETFVFSVLILALSLITQPASILLAESLHDDRKAREALASLVKGCCSDALFCFETVTDHRVPISDIEPCAALLQHLFSGVCTTQPDVPVCRAIARRYATHTRVTSRLGSILSSAFTHRNISLDVFRLCCKSIGLDASDYGNQLVKKLSMKLKAREPLNVC